MSAGRNFRMGNRPKKFGQKGPLTWRKVSKNVPTWRGIKKFSGRLRFLMWEGLEVPSRELKQFLKGLRIFLEGLNFFRVEGVEAFSWWLRLF